MTRATQPVRGVLWTHGSGSDRDHPLALALAAGLAPLPVRRINFPYRDRGGKRPPDRLPVLLESLFDQVDAFCDELECGTDEIVIGGRSLGGRVCSVAVASGLVVAGLVAVSYPLHPPGRPDKLRTEHLGDLTTPTLFISGDRDPFGTPDELRSAIALVPASTALHLLPGGHEVKRSDDEVVALVRAFVGAEVESEAGA